MTVDVEQGLVRIVGGGSGVFYAVAADGTLTWWRHLGWQDGAVYWANNGSARNIGGGFNNFAEVLASHDGTLYGVTGSGDVWRYRYLCTDLATGAGSWEGGGAGTKVATGWNRYNRVWGGPDNVLWCTDLAGNLCRSQLINGLMSTPQLVGNGWGNFGWVGADAGGVVYGIKGGDLVWFRLVGSGWQNNARPVQIGNGWAEGPNRAFCAGGNGLFYWIALADSATGRDQDLWWIRLTNPLTVAADGGPRWANNGSPRKIGSGFTCEQTARMQGYCWPQSAAPGEQLGVKVSATYASVTAEVRRIAPGAAPTTVIPGYAVPVRMQTLQAGYRQNGTGWSDATTVTVPADWPSGLYAVRLTNASGETRDLPFVVKPAAPSAPLALILPTLTYHAYNIWSGRSQYTNVPTAGQRTLSMQRPSYVWTVDPNGGTDCHGYGDVLLARWLAGQGYQVDTYTDLDVHANPGLLSAYKGVILGGHPEYCTDEMRQAYACYTNNGGRLVYPGGNGLYERVTVAGGHQVTYRRPDGGRDLYADRGQPASQILGVDYVAAGWGTVGGYRVVADHPILAGTGLGVGSTFGATGYNGPASAIEFDMVPAGGTAQLIAVGQNTPTLGAHMTWADKPNGGWVFSASSLTFPGVLGNDQAAGQILRNVLDRAIA